ncbi:MAG: phosphoenolpyruvate--protein phosphotransferase [Fimbriiglobus sp.]
MQIRRGIAVSPGIAIGPALVLDTEGVVISRRTVKPEQVEEEITRLQAALIRAATDARRQEELLTLQLGRSMNIMTAHAVMFEDATHLRNAAELIRKHCFSAEYAFSRHVRDIIRRFDELPAGHDFTRLRADFQDLERQVLNQLMGIEPSGTIPFSGEPVIVLAADLTPSETAQLDPATVHAFATESGGPTSHTAIMAGALEIPAVVGVGRFLSEVSSGELVIVDGGQGVLIIDPDPATLRKYEHLKEDQVSGSSFLVQSLKDIPPVTQDGVRIGLLGNIEFPNEAINCIERGADGVGLYRTEFLYVNRNSDPTEAEHYEAYKAVLTTLGPTRPVVIRTLDIGADKFSSASSLLAGEKNPFLGLRSVRLCLKNLKLFKTQLRAILRAAVHGHVKIMFPMISTVMELRQCNSLLAEVSEDLEEQGIPFKGDIPVGTMIEVPSAAIMADVLAREVDFFSIGTNDLVQYTLAADRNNENVSGLYNSGDPAVLRLMKIVCDAAQAHNTEINVCGEMSAELMFTPLLIGLGVRQLSATPRKIPEIKRAVRNLSIPVAERIAREALRLETAREVTAYLREQQRRISPDSVD